MQAMAAGEETTTILEISERVEEEYNWVRRAVREMEDADLVQKDGRQRDQRTGRSCIGWRLTPRGFRILRAWRDA